MGSFLVSWGKLTTLCFLILTQAHELNSVPFRWASDSLQIITEFFSQLTEIFGDYKACCSNFTFRIKWNQIKPIFSSAWTLRMHRAPSAGKTIFLPKLSANRDQVHIPQNRDL